MATAERYVPQLRSVPRIERGGVLAQDTLSSLQDFVGARGRDGEGQLKRRGYRHIRTENSDSDNNEPGVLA